MAILRYQYELLGYNPGYGKLRQACPILATWDDHDFGLNDSDSRYPKRAESQQVMLDFYGVSKDSPRRSREGVYHAQILGPPGKRLQVILMDGRYFRSAPKPDTRTREEKDRLGIVGRYIPNTDPATTILGDAQWRWLGSQLREPAELRLLVSSFQFANSEHGSESWGNFPHERERLIALLESTRANGVILLSGDRHFAELSRAERGPYPLYDFTSSGMTHTSPAGAGRRNSRRVSGMVYDGLNFGTVSIDWAQSDPLITLRAHQVEGTVAFEFKLFLSELRIP
jgi:alkaline phosphatase D